MKDNYVRRGLLQGNTSIPTDKLPSLPGSARFDSDLNLQGLIPQNQTTSSMRINGDEVIFTDITASHIKSVIESVTTPTNDGFVSKYKADVINSVLVISSMIDTRLEISSINNPTTGDAAKLLGFYQLPDPRAVSLSDELSSSPSREYALNHNLTSYISKFEDKTSESINRAVDSVAKNAEDLHIRLSRHRFKIGHMQLNAYSDEEISGTISEKTEKLKYLKSNNYALYLPHTLLGDDFTNKFVVQNIDISSVQNYSISSLPSLSSAITQQSNIHSSYSIDIVDEGSGDTKLSNKAYVSYDNNPEQFFGKATAFQTKLTLQRVDEAIPIGADLLLSRPFTVLQSGDIQSGYIQQSGTLKSVKLHSSSILVLDQVTVELTSVPSESVRSVIKSSAICYLNIGESAYAYDVVDLVGNNRLILQPIADLNGLTNYSIESEYSQTLPIGKSGNIDIFLGRSVPHEFIAVCHLDESCVLRWMDVNGHYLKTFVDTTYLPDPITNNASTQIMLGKMNSGNVEYPVDSLHAALLGNLSNRDSRSKIAYHPHVKSILSASAFSHGKNNISSVSISNPTASNQVSFIRSCHKFILSKVKNGLSGYKILKFLEDGKTEDQLTILIVQSICEFVYEPYLETNYRLDTTGQTKTVGSWLTSISYASTKSNPLLVSVLFMILEVIPACRLDGCTIESIYDGLISLNTQDIDGRGFTVADLGREFTLGNPSIICKMVEFISAKRAKFINIADGKYAQPSGNTSSISAVYGLPYNIAGISIQDATMHEHSIVNKSGSLDVSSFLTMQSVPIVKDSQGRIILKVPSTISDTVIGQILYKSPQVNPFSVDAFLFGSTFSFFERVGETTYPLYKSNARLYVSLQGLTSDGINVSCVVKVSEVLPMLTTVPSEAHPLKRLSLGLVLSLTPQPNQYSYEASQELFDSLTPRSYITLSNGFYEITDITDDIIRTAGMNITSVQLLHVESSRDGSLTYNKLSDNTSVELSKIDINSPKSFTTSIPSIDISTRQGIKSVSYSVDEFKARRDYGPADVPFTPSITMRDSVQSVIQDTTDALSVNVSYDKLPLISVSKSNGTAIHITDGSSDTHQSSLLSIVRDVSENVENVDEFGRDMNMSLSVVGSSRFVGPVRFESDTASDLKSLTNVNGTGINYIGGVDSNLNPTTSSVYYKLPESNPEDFNLGLSLSKVSGKSLGEKHVIGVVTTNETQFVITGSGNTSTEPFKYVDVVFQSDVLNSNANIGRHASLFLVSNQIYSGIITSINGFLLTVRLSPVDTIFAQANIKKVVIHGREWRANVSDINISGITQLKNIGSSNLVQVFVGPSGRLTLSGVKTDNVVSLLVGRRALNNLQIPQTLGQVSEYYKGNAYSPDENNAAGVLAKTVRLNYVPDDINTNQTFLPNGKFVLIKSKSYIPGLGAFSKLAYINADNASYISITGGGSNEEDPQDYADYDQGADAFQDYQENLNWNNPDDDYQQYSVDDVYTMVIEQDEFFLTVSTPENSTPNSSNFGLGYFSERASDLFPPKNSKLPQISSVNDPNFTDTTRACYVYDCTSRVFNDSQGFYVYVSLEGKLIRCNLGSSIGIASVSESYYTYIVFKLVVRCTLQYRTNLDLPPTILPIYKQGESVTYKMCLPSYYCLNLMVSKACVSLSKLDILKSTAGAYAAIKSSEFLIVNGTESAKTDIGSRFSDGWIDKLYYQTELGANFRHKVNGYSYLLQNKMGQNQNSGSVDCATIGLLKEVYLTFTDDKQPIFVNRNGGPTEEEAVNHSISQLISASGYSSSVKDIVSILSPRLISDYLFQDANQIYQEVSRYSPAVDGVEDKANIRNILMSMSTKYNSGVDEQTTGIFADDATINNGYTNSSFSIINTLYKINIS